MAEEPTEDATNPPTTADTPLAPGEAPDPQPGQERPFGSDHGTPPPARRPYAHAEGEPPPGPPPPPYGAPDPRYQPPPGYGPSGYPIQPPPGYGPSGYPIQPPGPYYPGPPLQPPGPPPAPTPPRADPQTIAAVRRANIRALLYAVSGLVLGFVLLGFGALFVPLALVVDIGALVLAARARRAARAAGQSDSAGIVAIIVASLGIAFVIAVLAMVAVFWNELRAYNDCMAGANTNQAREICQDQLSSSIMHRLGV